MYRPSTLAQDGRRDLFRCGSRLSRSTGHSYRAILARDPSSIICSHILCRQAHCFIFRQATAIEQKVLHIPVTITGIWDLFVLDAWRCRRPLAAERSPGSNRHDLLVCTIRRSSGGDNGAAAIEARRIIGLVSSRCVSSIFLAP